MVSKWEKESPYPVHLKKVCQLEVDSTTAICKQLHTLTTSTMWIISLKQFSLADPFPLWTLISPSVGWKSWVELIAKGLSGSHPE